MDSGDNGRLFRENNVLGGVLITGVGKETPVDISPVAHIRVVILGGGRLKNPLDQALGLLRPLKEQLNHCSEDLQLSLRTEMSAC